MSKELDFLDEELRDDYLNDTEIYEEDDELGIDYHSLEDTPNESNKSQIQRQKQIIKSVAKNVTKKRLPDKLRKRGIKAMQILKVDGSKIILL